MLMSTSDRLECPDTAPSQRNPRCIEPTDRRRVRPESPQLILIPGILACHRGTQARTGAPCLMQFVVDTDSQSRPSARSSRYCVQAVACMRRLKI